MLQLGNKSLTLAKAKCLLTKPQNIMDKPAVQAKGGQGFLYRSADQSGRHDFQYDQYRFIYTGKYCDDKTGVYKRYYKLKDPDGKLKKTLPGFKRHVYSLIEDESDNESSTIIYLVHYMGDCTLHRDSAHGNAKTRKGSVFVHTSRTSLEGINQDDQNTPKQMYSDLQIGGLRQVDQFMMPTDMPRDVKHSDKTGCTSRQSLRISKDTLFNALKISDRTDDFVRMMQVYPNITIRMAHNDMLKETRNVLEISMVNTELPQAISYGAALSLGDFYVSVLGCRNVLLVGNPTFPVAFMVHEKEFMNNHELMLRDILNCLGMDKCSNIPLVTDREEGITKLLHDFFPDLRTFICLNHILKDAERWLRNNSAKSEEMSTLMGDICELVWMEGEAQFNDQYHTLANGCAGPPTNNISASMNKVLKTASEHKEMALDGMILWFHQMQTNYLNEFRRAECGHGDYVLKEEFRHLRKHHRDVEFPELMSV